MKTKILSLLTLCLSILMLYLTGCNKTEDHEKVNNKPSSVETILVTDLQADTASTNRCSFFNLKDGKEIEFTDSASDNWDIAFRRTSIYVNSGTSGPGDTKAQTTEGIFGEIKEAPESGYKQDTSNGTVIKDWYHYTGGENPEHAVLTIPGKIIFLKTGDGYYVKMEILSYYKGNPNTSTDLFSHLNTRPPSRFYTFRYAIQKDGSGKFE